MARPADVGDVYYNGYYFNEPISARVVIRPIEDTSARILKYIQYRLELVFYVFPGDDILGVPTGTAGSAVDDHFTSIRNLLTASGKELRFKDMGLGTEFVINSHTVAGGFKDITFGPKPRLIQWAPVGSNRAIRATWVCETTIPSACAAGVVASGILGKFTEFNYEVLWSINHEGMTTRTIVGRFEMSLNNSSVVVAAAGATTIPYSADQLRNWVAFPPIPGFKRNQDFGLSMDRRFMDFRIVDTEIPSDLPFPTHIVDIQVKQKVASTNSFGTPVTNQFSNSISGTITVRAGWPKSWAWEVFRLIAWQRTPIELPSEQNTQDQGKQWLSGISIEDDLFSRRISFTLNYVTITTLGNLFKTTKVISDTPVGTNTWEQWRDSNPQLFHVRGNAQLTHLASDDYLMTVCDSPHVTSTPPSITGGFLTSSDPFISRACPTPEYSWCWFENWLEIYIFQDGKIIHKGLVGGVEGDITDPKPTPGSFVGIAPPSLGNRNNPPSNQTENKVQIKSPATYKIVMRGMAVRICYIPVEPVLVSYKGAKAIREHNWFRNWTVSPDPATPVYGVVWQSVYTLTKPPEYTNPVIDTDGIPTGIDLVPMPRH